MRLIDADKLEPAERYVGDEFVRIVYMDDIDAQPAIETEPIKHGKWEHRIDHCVCSVCKDECWSLDADTYNYCPSCGAKMDEVE